MSTKQPRRREARRDDLRFSADQETAQAILRVQRMLCLMNAPHSYRLVDAATLLRQVEACSTANVDIAGEANAPDIDIPGDDHAIAGETDFPSRR